MRGIRARRDGDVMFGSAGWLFADLMLAVVVMLVLATATSAHEQPAHPAPPKPVTTKPSPTTTTTTRPPGMLPDPVEVNVDVDTNGLMNNNSGSIAATQQTVRAALAGPLDGRRVGVVLTFGTSPSGNIQRGIQVAGQFNSQVLPTLGPQFTGAAYRSYFQNGGDLNKITLDIFVFSD